MSKKNSTRKETVLCMEKKQLLIKKVSFLKLVILVHDTKQCLIYEDKTTVCYYQDEVF